MNRLPFGPVWMSVTIPKPRAEQQALALSDIELVEIVGDAIVQPGIVDPSRVPLYLRYSVSSFAHGRNQCCRTVGRGSAKPIPATQNRRSPSNGRSRKGGAAEEI
jgi:hypothetical protein